MRVCWREVEERSSEITSSFSWLLKRYPEDGNYFRTIIVRRWKKNYMSFKISKSFLHFFFSREAKISLVSFTPRLIGGNFLCLLTTLFLLGCTIIYVSVKVFHYLNLSIWDRIRWVNDSQWDFSEMILVNTYLCQIVPYLEQIRYTALFWSTVPPKKSPKVPLKSIN